MIYVVVVDGRRCVINPVVPNPLKTLGVSKQKFSNCSVRINTTYGCR